MNRRWILPLVAAVAIGIIAYAVTRHAVCGRPAPTLDRLQDVAFLTRELGLNDAQADEIKSLHASLGVKLNDCCMRHCAARARLAQALAAETNGTAQAETILAEMCRAYEESERATLEHMRRVRALLTPEQRKHFDEMITACLCGACSMPNGTMPTGARTHEHSDAGR